MNDAWNEDQIIESVTENYRKHVENLTKERDTLKKKIEKYHNLLNVYEDLYHEIAFLINSGYDGPFMGQPVERLFKAYAKTQKNKK